MQRFDGRHAVLLTKFDSATFQYELIISNQFPVWYNCAGKNRISSINGLGRGNICGEEKNVNHTYVEKNDDNLLILRNSFQTHFTHILPFAL